MFPVRCSDRESKNRPFNSERKSYVPLRYFWICRVVSMFLWSMCRWENILKLTLLGKCSEWMKCWYLFCTWTEYREETRVVKMSNTSKLEVYLLWMSHGMAWRTTIGSIPSPDHFLLLSFCPVPLAQEWLRWLILTSGFPCYIWKLFDFYLLSKYQIHDIVCFNLDFSLFLSNP